MSYFKSSAVLTFFIVEIHSNILESPQNNFLLNMTLTLHAIQLNAY